MFVMKKRLEEKNEIYAPKNSIIIQQGVSLFEE
jgi:hypothetical protein